MPASNNTLRSYTSSRVYDGTRPVSAALANKLRARHKVKKPSALRTFTLFSSVTAIFAVAIQFAKTLHHS